MWRDGVGVPAAKRQRCCTERDAVWEPPSALMTYKDQGAARGQANHTVSCPVCLEHVPKLDAVRLDGCRHAFCRDCLATHFSHSVREHVLPVRCPLPRCTTVVSHRTIKSVLPVDDARCLDQLNMASLIPEHLQFYCPYSDCAALMEVAAEEQLPGCPSQCPACRRAVCSACRSGWHEGMTCSHHQALRRPSEGGSGTQQLPQPQLPISRQASLATEFGRAVNVFGPGQAAAGWQQQVPALSAGLNMGQQWQAVQYSGTKAMQYGQQQQQAQQQAQHQQQQQAQQQWQVPMSSGGRQAPYGQQMGMWPGMTPAAMEMRQGEAASSAACQAIYAWGM